MKNQRKRYPISRSTWHPDFDFVKPGEENLFITGFGDAGKVYDDPEDYAHFTRTENGHHFIRCHNEETIEKFKLLEESLIDFANFKRTTGVGNISQSIMIGIYKEAYGEPELFNEKSETTQ